MTGRLCPETTRRDLVNRGLWGLSVRVIDDGEVACGVKLRAGECGMIAWPATVGAAIFDLGREAPVMGLAAFPNAAIGVPWERLEVL